MIPPPQFVGELQFCTPWSGFDLTIELLAADIFLERFAADISEASKTEGSKITKKSQRFSINSIHEA
jgi:hypothetical protein